MDQEEVASKFEKYGFLTIPVVDEKNKMLGIVTVDDIMVILKEETTEDIHRLGGVDEEEKVDGSLFNSIRSRLPWLIINLITAILAATVVGFFEGTISKVVALATFMPIVAGMEGNAGTQSLTIVVRGIALGELTGDNARRGFFKRNRCRSNNWNCYWDYNFSTRLFVGKEYCIWCSYWNSNDIEYGSRQLWQGF